MLQVHYELTGAIHSCSRETANETFKFDKAVDSFYCKKCVSIMEQFEYFDSKHIDTCIGTVQKNKRSEIYQCVFCRTEYKNYTGSIWEDD
ncbi:hypothetical protein [Acinetobacter sp. ANC 4633]|uniref:hypothetical protein n=1 Tax=Acinetobacter sp. ANC 4633 TaxID=2529845 RepID=UPI001D17F2BB|nr:hypothetical protein [Acinetobacter sp. ANC 4633]